MADDSVTRGYLLIVDNEPMIRRLIALMLARTDVVVHEAANGGEALAMVRAQPPALILLDLTMPVMDGWRFLDEYEHLPAPRAPVLLFTSHIGGVDQALRSRVAAVLPKPVLRDKLLEVIRLFWMSPHSASSTSGAGD
jgi:CheY-like chemotaxis protein